MNSEEYQNITDKQEETFQQDRKETPPSDGSLSYGLGIGLCLGVAFGVLLLHNIALGLCIGVSLGLAVGSGTRQKK